MPAHTAYRFPHAQLLGVAGLNRLDAEDLLDTAESHLIAARDGRAKTDVLRGAAVLTAFFEPSTRTRVSFELAAKRLGADALNIATGSASAEAKGERLADTLATLDAMRPDVLVIRHAAAGAARFAAARVKAAVVNAGDGCHEHPTQALLDAFALRRRIGSLEGKTVAICGDVARSRVARSNLVLLQLLGARVRLLAPQPWLPVDAAVWGAEPFTDRSAALAGAHAVMALRIQTERTEGASLASTADYAAAYRIDRDALAACDRDVVVMHPGPANRGVEVTSDVLDDPDLSIAGAQVEAGVAVRMAVLAAVARNAREAGR